MTTVGILLAAGRGRRFDPDGARNKLLAPISPHEPVVAASARALLRVLPTVIAVVPPNDGGVAQVLRDLGCEVTVCADADSGMGTSLAHAVGHSLPGASAWVVALGDMPYVQASTIAALCQALEQGAAIAAPMQGGRRGNPVGFGSAHLQALLALHGDQGARAIVQSNPVHAVQVDDPGIFHDLDTASDFNKTVTLPLGGQVKSS